MHVQIRVRRWLKLTGLLLGGAAGFTALSAQTGQELFDPKLRVEVNYVEEDVRVLDREGRFISGLTAADFIVVEDGVGQRIRSFGITYEF